MAYVHFNAFGVNFTEMLYLLFMKDKSRINFCVKCCYVCCYICDNSSKNTIYVLQTIKKYVLLVFHE